MEQSLKKIAAAILVIAAVFLCLSPISACADEYNDSIEEITENVENIMSGFSLDLSLQDAERLSLDSLLAKVTERLTDRLGEPVRLLAVIFMVIVLCAVISSAGNFHGNTSGDVYSMVCVMAAVAVILPRIMAVYSEILSLIHTTGGFILVFVPFFTGIAVTSGSITTAGIYHVMMLGASELIVKLAESWFMPILGAAAALGITGSIFPNLSLDSLVNLLKKVITWGISVAMTLFTGFVSLKCTIGSKADGAAAKTAKMLVGNFVPIVGSAVSDAYSTVKGSFQVIGGAVGAVGISGIIILLLPMIIEVLLYRFVMWTGIAAAEIFSAESLRRLMKSIDSGLAIAQCILVCYSVIFVLCSAILISAMGG
ncbi:MAG: stage III sporulation protein AE [Alistipes sp.]|nr:stage III sporulation protein AE [Alistipes sp.]